jgi:hypothetical protein
LEKRILVDCSWSRCANCTDLHWFQ